MKKALKHLFLFTFLILLGTSCANRKKMIYFQDIDKVAFGEGQNREITFQPGDILSILVSAPDPEAAEPFNLSTDRLNNGGQIGLYTRDNTPLSGYSVGTDGTINFPILGKVEVAGKNREELEETLEKLLEDHLQYASVNVRLGNFKIAVLGDVRSPGTFSIVSGNASLPEVLGIAGDLNITAKRENVLVIREEGGEKIHYRVDLTGSELFSSPVYYLKQNDIVYVEPNQAKLTTAKFTPVYSVLISVTSLIITIAILLTN